MTGLTDKKPFVEMMRQIRLDMFDRLERGKINYQRDMKILEKHLTIVKEFGDPILMAATYNLMGTIDSNMGYFQSSLGHFTSAYAEALKTKEYPLLASIQNNLGELRRRMGNLDDALTAYRQSQQHSRQGNISFSYLIAEMNIGLCLIEKKEIDQAAGALMNALTSFRADSDNFKNHESVIIYVINGLAEICLARKQYEQAWEYIKEAEFYAIDGDFKLLGAEVNLLKAHIADADPNAKEKSAYYYALARDVLKASGTPIQLARALLEEARYQHHHHHIAEAHQLASEAQEMFKQLNLAEEADMAKNLLINGSV